MFSSTSPVGGISAGVDVDERGVEADPSTEESFAAQSHGHVVGVADLAVVDDVEGLVARVIGIVDGSRDLAIVAGATVGGAKANEWGAEAFADFVGDAKGRGQFFPEALGGEFVVDAVRDVAMRLDDFIGGDVAEVEGVEELGVFLFARERAGSGFQFHKSIRGFIRHKMFGIRAIDHGFRGGWSRLGSGRGDQGSLRFTREAEEAATDQGGTERSQGGKGTGLQELSPPQYRAVLIHVGDSGPII
jgi:hypothetical protein